MYRVVDKEVLSPSIKCLEIEAPRIAVKAQPGQFFMFRLDERGERIPLTIADFDRKRGTITSVFQEVGRSTRQLGQLSCGDFILDVVGPLGVPSEIRSFGTVVCVGGGVGVAPIYPIARALSQYGNRVITIMGARTKELLFWETRLAEVSSAVVVCTDDGSYGRKGLVTDALKDVIRQERIDRVWAIGPLPMMRAVAEVTRPFGVKTIVSLNPIMVDGTGMCGGCRVTVGDETKFACVDGPEFDGHLVDFETAIRRLAYYKDAERRAEAVGSCGGKC